MYDDEDLQDVFTLFKSKHIRTIGLDMDLLPLAWSPPDEFIREVSPSVDSNKSFNQHKTPAKHATDDFVFISFDDKHNIFSEHGTSNVSTSSEEDSDFVPQSKSEDAEIV
ncbi:hypothetical protein ACOSP7_028657 [Xanthoceras sorbifolium]